VGTDNKYGHPSNQILSRLRDAEAAVYRTDSLGTVVAHSDGSQITVTWETGGQPQLPSGENTVYIGNKKSKTLHTESCSALPSESNQVLFDELQTALDEGYKLCSQCME
jgi:competence protein ComEC